MSLAKLRSTLWTAPAIALATAFLGTVSLIAAWLDSSGRAPHGVARAWGRLLCAIARSRIHIHGLDKISHGGAYVYVANHRSLMDIPVLMSSLPGQFRFFATRGLFKIPFIGTHLKAAGHIQVDRQNAKEAVRSLTQGARTITERGYSVLLFPEGGRTEGELRTFRDGAAFVAIRAGAPIVPIFLRGMRDVLPMGSFVVQPARVDIYIGDPIPVEGLKMGDRGQLTNRLFAFFQQHEQDPEAPAPVASPLSAK